MALRFLPRLRIPFLPARFSHRFSPKFRVSIPILPLTSRLRQSPTPSPHRLSSHPSITPDLSWTQRLRSLIKSYGWYALGVYIVLSALDFSVAFAAIHLLGADHVSHITTSFKQSVARLIRSKPLDPGAEVDSTNTTVVADGQGGLYTIILLAYTVHKTLFLPVRIGLTGVLTPKLVNWLRVRGWAGGEGTRRAAMEIRERMRRRSGD